VGSPKCALRARPLESVFAAKASPSSPTAAWGELSVMCAIVGTMDTVPRISNRRTNGCSPQNQYNSLRVFESAAGATGKSGTPSPNGNRPADGKLCATLTALARPDLKAAETRQKRGFPPTSGSRPSSTRSPGCWHSDFIQRPSQREFAAMHALPNRTRPPRLAPATFCFSAGCGTMVPQTINAIETSKYEPFLPLAFKIARVSAKKIEEILSDEADAAPVERS
jgi:hypothetical protein